MCHIIYSSYQTDSKTTLNVNVKSFRSGISGHGLSFKCSKTMTNSRIVYSGNSLDW